MDRLQQFLPPRPQNVGTRYGIATALVGVSFAALHWLHSTSDIYGFYVLFPAIFLVSIGFDRGSGLYAAALSAALIYIRLKPAGGFALPMPHAVALGTFVVLAAFVALVSEALRAAWERALAAERTKDLLLQELAHRTKNDLAAVISLLSLQARSQPTPEAKAALHDAAARIRAIAAAHDFLTPLEDDVRIDMQGYLTGLCDRLSTNLRGIRNISIVVEAPHVEVASDQAIMIGLVVNELVTNALKHAFPGERGGVVRVALHTGAALTLTVEDDGIGCPAGGREGTGTRLVRLLVEQIGGTITWEAAVPGCRVTTIPSPPAEHPPKTLLGAHLKLARSGRPAD